VPIQPADFLAPQGDLEPDWFPDEEDVSARLAGYINEAAVKASGLVDEVLEAALVAWVYHRAYHSIWVRLSANPNSLTFADQGSRSYNQSQINSFRDLAREYLLEFNGYIAETPSQLTRAPRSTSVPNVYHW
jgi:hypothetical protein